MPLREHHPADDHDKKRDAHEHRHSGRIRAGDAFSGDGNGFHETPWGSGTPGYLPTVRRYDEAAGLRFATDFKDAVWLCLNSAVRLEDRVDLAAVLDHFPGAGEPGRYQECIAGAEAHALAGRALDDDPSSGHHAQL